jgi:hypothetical protein
MNVCSVSIPSLYSTIQDDDKDYYFAVFLISFRFFNTMKIRSTFLLALLFYSSSSNLGSMLFNLMQAAAFLKAKW